MALVAPESLSQHPAVPAGWPVSPHAHPLLPLSVVRLEPWVYRQTTKTESSLKSVCYRPADTSAELARKGKVNASVFLSRINAALNSEMWLVTRLVCYRSCLGLVQFQKCNFVLFLSLLCPKFKKIPVRNATCLSLCLFVVLSVALSLYILYFCLNFLLV